MKLRYDVYVLTEADERAIGGPVQVVEAPSEDEGHDAKVGSKIDLILAKVEGKYHDRRLRGIR